MGLAAVRLGDGVLSSVQNALYRYGMVDMSRQEALNGNASLVRSFERFNALLTWLVVSGGTQSTGAQEPVRRDGAPCAC
jgi:hypothetical protein